MQSEAPHRPPLKPSDRLCYPLVRVCVIFGGEGTNLHAAIHQRPPAFKSILNTTPITCQPRPKTPKRPSACLPICPSARLPGLAHPHKQSRGAERGRRTPSMVGRYPFNKSNNKKSAERKLIRFAVKDGGMWLRGKRRRRRRLHSVLVILFFINFIYIFRNPLFASTVSGISRISSSFSFLYSACLAWKQNRSQSENGSTLEHALRIMCVVLNSRLLLYHKQLQGRIFLPTKLDVSFSEYCSVVSQSRHEIFTFKARPFLPTKKTLSLSCKPPRNYDKIVKG